MSDISRILVVDDSRVVRTSIARHLKGLYEVREEVDGESAWQTLVLDPSISAVISGLQMPVLDGFGLLARVRACRLQRLRDIPFVLISGGEDQETLEKAANLGVSDFISKDIQAAELKTRLHNLLQFTMVRQSLAESLSNHALDEKTGLYTRRYLELQVAQALAHSRRHGVSSCLMVIGFDNYADIVSQMGEEKATEMSAKFARKVSNKVRQEDCVGHFSPGRFAVVAPGTLPEDCVVFANRLRRAISDAVFSVGGRRITLSMSAGIASAPRDNVDSAIRLLELAYQRMEAAIAVGGNRTESGEVVQAEAPPLKVEEALSLIAAKHPDAVHPQLLDLLEQIKPLLLILQQECKVEFPLDTCQAYLAANRQSDSGHVKFSRRLGDT